MPTEVEGRIKATQTLSSAVSRWIHRLRVALPQTGVTAFPRHSLATRHTLATRHACTWSSTLDVTLLVYSFLTRMSLYTAIVPIKGEGTNTEECGLFEAVDESVQCRIVCRQVQSVRFVSSVILIMSQLVLVLIVSLPFSFRDVDRYRSFVDDRPICRRCVKAEIDTCCHLA